MKEILRALPWILLSIIAGYILFFGPSRPDIIEVPGETVYDTLYVSFESHDTVYVPAIDTIYVKGDEKIIEIIKELDIDTASIIRDFLSLVISSDTLVDTPTLFATVTDSIYMNRIIGRGFYYNQTERVITKTNTVMVYDEKPKLYVGASYNVPARDLFVGAAFSRGDWLISLDYGLSSTHYIAGVKYKFKLK